MAREEINIPHRIRLFLRPAVFKISRLPVNGRVEIRGVTLLSF
jgi:hypothetical protein